MKQHEFIRQTSDLFQMFYKERFITHRDGNATLKLENDEYFVTASGVNKSYMSIGDFVTVDKDLNVKMDEHFIDFKEPSIETRAHISALEATKKQVSIHVHSPKTVALFEVYNNRTHSIHILETKIRTKWPELFRYTKLGKTIEFLDPGSKELHEAIKDSFLFDNPDIIVLQRHGVLSVGKDLQEAMEHIIRLEHISSILLDIEKAK